MIKSNPPAFILGAGLNALGLVRPLGRTGIRCVVFDRARKDVAYCSRYCEAVILKSRDDQDMLDILEHYAKREPAPPVLFATGDPDIRFLTRNREQLNKNFRFMAPTWEATDLLTNKTLFADFIEKHGFPGPRTISASTAGDIERAADEMCFPAIIKPALSAEWLKTDFIKRFGLIKMVRLENSDQLRRFWDNLGTTSRALIIQELIPGADDQQYHYYSFRNGNNRELTSLIARRLRIFPIHGGVGVFVIAEHNPELAEISRQVLDTLSFIGTSSICFKRHRETGEYKIFEINGRFPMNHSIFTMCGIDLPGIYYKAALGREISKPRPTNIGRKWMWLEYDLRASFDYWRSGELSVIDYLRSLSGTRMVVEFAHDDLGPFRFTLSKMASAAIKSLPRFWK